MRRSGACHPGRGYPVSTSPRRFLHGEGPVRPHAWTPCRDRLTFRAMRSTGGTLPPVRVSDAERERALRELREAAVQGRLSSDSFLRRLDDALRSRNRDDLADLVRDLPADVACKTLWCDAPAQRPCGFSGFGMPGSSPASPDCRFPPTGTVRTGSGGTLGLISVFSNRTVSRSHARLNLGPDGWILTDLGSTNGTPGERLDRPRGLKSCGQVIASPSVRRPLSTRVALPRV